MPTQVPDIADVPRNRPDQALEVLRRRHALGVLRDEDITIALKLQDDRTSLIEALGDLAPNDPDDA